MTLEAIRYKDRKLDILDQLKLPAQSEYISIDGVEAGWRAINTMQVRGAPAIAIVGCLSLVVELTAEKYESKQKLKQDIEGKLNYLVSARPTAVNMKIAADHLTLLANNLVEDGTVSASDAKEKWIIEVEGMLEKDISDNKAIGAYGAEAILTGGIAVSVLTHCNTGSLATAGYGTALGVIRSIHASNKLEMVYCTETRPYNQGARLTAYELVHDNIPCTLICDSMVATLMKNRRISAVVVGADRVAANGDTANKVGTYGIAVLARYHKVPFYVCAPHTSIDRDLPNGSHIVIEQRPDKEMTHIGDIRIAARGMNCWNPAFDVTPAELITGIVTETGVYPPNAIQFNS